MITYRVEAIDEQGSVVHTISGDIGTLDGVLVFQIADDMRLSDAEMQRVKMALEAAFPDRRVLLLMPGIRFVRFVRVTE